MRKGTSGSRRSILLKIPNPINLLCFISVFLYGESSVFGAHSLVYRAGDRALFDRYSFEEIDVRYVRLFIPVLS